jgi:hypothetical protein
VRFGVFPWRIDRGPAQGGLCTSYRRAVPDGKLRYPDFNRESAYVPWIGESIEDASATAHGETMHDARLAAGQFSLMGV